MRARLYSGGRYKVSLTREAEAIREQHVGNGKGFRRFSDLVNYCLVYRFGSELQKRQDSKERLMAELQSLVAERRKLRERKDSEACIGVARFLANYYQMPLGLELADKAQGDWDEHWNEDEGFAVWTNDKGRQVKVAVKDDVLRVVLAAMNAQDLDEKIRTIGDELRRIEAIKVPVA